MDVPSVRQLVPMAVGQLQVAGRAWWYADVEPALAVSPRTPPSDAEMQAAMTAAATALRQAADEANDSAAASARRLADALDKVRAATPEVRAAAASAVDAPLKVLLDQIRAMLQAVFSLFVTAIAWPLPLRAI